MSKEKSATPPTRFLKDFLGNFLGGVDSGVDPHLLKKNKLAWAVNSTVRGGYISPMPKIVPFNLSDGGALVIGGSQGVSSFVQSGLFQGAAFYNPNAASALPAGTLFALISGRLFGFTPDFSVVAGKYVSSLGYVAVVEYTINNSGTPDLNSTTAPQAWLGQAENYLIVQDGTTPNPLVFDGNNSFRSYSLQTLVATFKVNPNGGAGSPAIGATFSGTIATDLTAGTIPDIITPVSIYAGSTAPAGYVSGQYLGQMTFQKITASGNFSAILVPLSGSPSVVAGSTVWLQNLNYPISNQSFNISAGFPAAYATNLTIGTADAFNAQNTSGFVAGSMVAVATVAQYKVPNGSPYGTPASATGKTTQVTSGQITPSAITPSSFLSIFPSDPYGSLSKITSVVLKFQVQSSSPNITYTPIGTLAADYTLSGATPVLFAAGATYPPSSAQGATVFVGTNSTTPSSNQQCSISSYTNSGSLYYLTNQSVAAGINLNTCTIQTLIGIPCGKMWAYCQGRIWTSLPNGTQFVAGDIVGGSSGTSANNFLDAILYTMQNTLLSNGGTFSLPGNYGQIRAMVVAPTLNVALGQGALQVLTTQCIFSVNAPADITTWAKLTSPIVVTSLIGSGGMSQSGSVQVNGDILFRSQDGIRSMTIASLDFYKWNQTPCSNEVQRIISQDDYTLLQFSTACLFDNRVIFGCSPLTTPNGVISQSAVAINLDTISNLQDKSPAVWEGVWNGLNTLQYVTGMYGNLSRCFQFTSANSSIVISEILTTADGQDVQNSGATNFQFESSVLFNNNEAQGEYDLLRLEDGEIYVQNIIGVVTFTFEFRSDYGDWNPWYSWTVDNTDGKTPYKTRMGLGCPYGDSANSSGFEKRDGYDFQIRATFNGSCQFMGGAVKASIVPQTEFAKPISSVPTPPPPPTAPILKQAFAGYGAPTNQNPSGASGIYFDAQNNEFYLWLGNQWDGGIIPSGSSVVSLGRQAFNGSGAPNASTPTPANNAGTYFDYSNSVIYFWNPLGYWGDDVTASGSGVVANSLGQDYLSGSGIPTTQKPANGAGIYYDILTLTIYNWNPINNAWI